MRNAGHKVKTRAFDVADEEAVSRLSSISTPTGVEIDILVNNAGIQFRKPMVDLKTDEWRRVVEIHLTGAFQVGREAAKRMIARGRGGKIINIASLASEVARATIAPYVAAKGGVRMLTRSMAAEWAKHDIQANAIGPGYIATEMNRALLDDPKFDAWVKGRTPSGRWGKPDDLIGVDRVPRLAGLGLRERPDHLCRWRAACRDMIEAHDRGQPNDQQARPRFACGMVARRDARAPVRPEAVGFRLPCPLCRLRA